MNTQATRNAQAIQIARRDAIDASASHPFGALLARLGRAVAPIVAAVVISGCTATPPAASPQADGVSETKKDSAPAPREDRPRHYHKRF